MLNCGGKNVSILQRTQNGALRAIVMVDRCIPVKGMLYVLDVMSVKERIKFNVRVLVYKMKNGLTPRYLNELVQTVEEMHEYNTRNKDKIVIRHTKTVTAEKSLEKKGFKMFNELPKCIRETENVERLKLKLREYMVGNAVEDGERMNTR